MTLTPELIRFRIEQPVTFAAFEALGKEGWIEIELLWPAVKKLADIARAEPMPFEIDDVDLIGMGALISAMRSEYPSVDATVVAMLEVSGEAAAEGRPVSPKDFPPRMRQRFEQLMSVASRAMCKAASELEPA